MHSRHSRVLAAEYVVGVGASAGGLEAMLLFFSQVQANGRVAYVVAQHMAHGAHTELMVRVIQRESVLPVCVGTDGQALEPDRVYVIPADHDGVIGKGVLSLRPPSLQRISTPSVNVLLESLAQQMGTHGFAVVLSGAGWDGARGCLAVQRAGGTVIVQDHNEASFPSMPDAVLEAGCAARHMQAARIGPWLAHKLSGVDADEATLAQEPELAAQADSRPPTAATLPSASPPAAEVPTLLPEAPAKENLLPLLARVSEVTGLDFSEYREETLLRRLQSRRRHLDLTPAAYAALLQRDRREVERLQRLFLVSLSSFWRDRECFEALGRALATRLAQAAVGTPIRVWVPGCASGEEVYTLAAMLAEAVTRGGLQSDIQVIGTDLNEDALEQARLGQYPRKAFQEAPPGWTDRWFTHRGETYTVRPELSDLVRFERSDIELGSPDAFSAGQVDVISCRNLLIYFLPGKQDRLLSAFGRALRPDGLLMIGPSEHLGPAAQAAFRTLDAERRIYVRRP